MGVAGRVMRLLQLIWKSLRDNLPPYYEVHGSVKAKETNDNGMPYIIVNAAVIEVDRVTYGRLAVGDNLRVKYTRTARAISIDKLTARPNSQESSLKSP